MYNICAHIYSEIENSEELLKKLELKEREVILESVLEKYIDEDKKSTWLWEKFIHYEALNDNMGWSFIKDFVKNNECIMFFNQDEDKEMILIKTGDDLNHILSETYGFEFYITNKEVSYLLCFSHHNILYGCGEAEKWLYKLKIS